MHSKLSSISGIDNPRSNITANKYRKQINWRTNKVRQFLVRGYSQSEMASALHISQPAISRDISYFHRQICIKDKQEYGKDLMDSYQRTVFGTNELIRKIWEIVDNPKTDTKSLSQKWQIDI